MPSQPAQTLGSAGKCGRSRLLQAARQPPATGWAAHARRPLRRALEVPSPPQPPASGWFVALGDRAESSEGG